MTSQRIIKFSVLKILQNSHRINLPSSQRLKLNGTVKGTEENNGNACRQIIITETFVVSCIFDGSP